MCHLLQKTSANTFFETKNLSSNSGKQRSSCLLIGPRCTRDTFCHTIAKTSANDLLDKGKFCQNGQIFKGADVLPRGRTIHDKPHSNAPRMPDNNTLLIGYCVWSGLKNNKQNFSTIGGKTRLCAEERSWKDGNTGVGTKECGGDQFAPINGGEKK